MRLTKQENLAKDRKVGVYATWKNRLYAGETKYETALRRFDDSRKENYENGSKIERFVFRFGFLQFA